MMYLGDQAVGINNIRTKNTHGVPPEYIEFDCIIFSGTQWIDTEYVWNENSTFIIENTRFGSGMQQFSEILKGTNIYVQYGTVNGCYIKIGSMSEINLTNNIGFFGIKNKLIFSTSSAKMITPIPTKRSPFSASYTTNINTTGTITLSNSSRPWTGLIHSFEVQENNIQVVYMIPVKRILDGVFGMYDVIRNKFYTDASNTGFICENIEYIEEGGGI